MIRFRRLELKDLDDVYQDPHLRNLLLVEPAGEKFGVVLESEGRLLGGITGYTLADWGRIQRTCVRPEAQDTELLDGLLRSVIHILELSGCAYLLSEESGPLYQRAGFQSIEVLSEPVPDAFADTLPEGRSFFWLNLPAFFRSDPHGADAERR